MIVTVFKKRKEKSTLSGSRHERALACERDLHGYEYKIRKNKGNKDVIKFLLNICIHTKQSGYTDL